MAVKTLLTQGYRKEVSAITPLQKRYYTMTMTLDDNLDPLVISNIVEDLCDVVVKKVKDVTEWQYTLDEPDSRDLHINGEYKIDGQTAQSNKIFLPRVHARHSIQDVELKLKQLFGPSFKIRAYREDL